mgnify:CR=1 FL=1
MNIIENDAHLTVKGEGKPLLFLHGYLSSRQSFAYQLEYFSKFFKVIAPDLMGFNGLKMEYPYSLDDYARDVSRLIEGEKRVNVIAHSFGARVLFKMLPDDRIDRIVLTGAAGLKPRPSLKKSVAIFRYKLRKKLKLPTDKFGSDDYKKLDTIMKRSFVSVVNERLDGRIRNIKNPCLIVFGENDRETPVYMAKKLNKMIDGSALVLIGRAGHFAFVDQPQYFNRIVKEFLL